MERSHDKTGLAKSSRTGIRLATTFLAVALVASSTTSAIAADDAAGIAFFETKIRPVLVEKCHECHSSGAKKLRGGLRLDTREGTRSGGDSGPAVVPGNLEESLLFQAITATNGIEPMPPKGRLPATVVADFREWIKLGAPDPRDGKSVPLAAANRPLKSDWWSLQPLSRPRVPEAYPAGGGPGGEPDRRVRLCQARRRKASLSRLKRTAAR